MTLCENKNGSYKFCRTQCQSLAIQTRRGHWMYDDADVNATVTLNEIHIAHFDCFMNELTVCHVIFESGTHFITMQQIQMANNTRWTNTSTRPPFSLYTFISQIYSLSLSVSLFLSIYLRANVIRMLILRIFYSFRRVCLISPDVSRFCCKIFG